MGKREEKPPVSVPERAAKTTREIPVTRIAVEQIQHGSALVKRAQSLRSCLPSVWHARRMAITSP